MTTASRRPLHRAAAAAGAFVLLLEVAGGCSAPKLDLKGGVAYPPTKPETVRIYRSRTPDQPFQEIGTFTWELEDGDLEGMFNTIRKRAASAGATAVLHLRRAAQIGFTMATGANGRPRMRTTIEAKYTGVLIREQ